MKIKKTASKKPLEAQEREIKLRLLSEIHSWAWPPGTDKLLLDVLREKDCDPESRALAIEMAGDIMVINEALTKVLLHILQDGEELEEMRARAVYAFHEVLEFADTQGFDDPDELPISEATVQQIQKVCARLFQDVSTPLDLRRTILITSVRFPQDWHRDAIATAYASGDPTWVLAAVLAMRYVSGFDAEILQALTSKNRDLKFEAVCAAASWSVSAAWPHIEAIINAKKPNKDLLLAAIDAVVAIRPEEAIDVLGDFLDAEDEDIADAANEAIAMAEILLSEDDEEDEEELET